MKRIITIILAILSPVLLAVALLWDLAKGQAFSISLKQALPLVASLIGFFGLVVINNRRLSAWSGAILRGVYESFKTLLIPGREEAAGNSRVEQYVSPRQGMRLSPATISYICIIFAILAVIGSSAPVPSYRWPGTDSSIFAYFGRQLLNGKILYTQLFDHKPPLVFYMDSLGLWLGRNTFWGVWLLELASLFLSSVIIFKFIKNVFGILPAFIAIVAGIINLSIPFEQGNLTEEYAILYQALALVLLFSDSLTGKPLLQFFLVGLCGGIAFLFKTNIIGLWVAISVVLLIKSPGKYIPRLLIMLAGFLSINLLIVGIFALQGNLREYWLVAYQYNFLHRVVNSANASSIYFESANTFASLSPFYFVCVLTWVYLIIKFVRKSIASGFKAALGEKLYTFYGLLIIYYPIELFLANFSGRNFPHYYMSLWVGSVGLLAVGLHDFARWIVRQKERMAYRLPAILLVASLINPILLFSKLYPVKKEGTIRPTIEYIIAHTQPEDKIFVFGMWPSIYYATDRESATRYIFTDPLHNTNYASQAVVDEFIAEFIRNSPKLIVETWDIHAPGIQIGEDGQCSYAQDPQVPGLNQLCEYICAHYHLVASIGKDNWLVYQRLN